MQNSAISDPEDEESRYAAGDDDYLNYFVASNRRYKTSDRSLKDIDCDFSEEDVRRIANAELADEKGKLIVEYENKWFKKWYHMLSAGFNLVLYGVGSKKSLIDHFCQNYLSDQYHIVINGFFGDLTLKNLTDSLNEAIELTQPADEYELFEQINQFDNDLYIAIHSVDILFTTSEKIQKFVNNLMVKCPSNVHLLMTVDHVNSGILWDSSQCNNFNLLWFNVPTYQSYTTERSYASSSTKHSKLASSITQNLTLSSIQHVYNSLNHNAQKIFILIAQYYLNHQDSNEEGLTFSDCYRSCREEFLVNSEVTLRAQLTEFKDHQLIKLAKASDGGELIKLLVDRALVERFLNTL